MSSNLYKYYVAHGIALPNHSMTHNEITACLFTHQDTMFTHIFA